MSAEQASAAIPPTLQFVGIDRAGDSGITGVAVISVGAAGPRYGFPRGSWKGAKGLPRLKDVGPRGGRNGARPAVLLPGRDDAAAGRHADGQWGPRCVGVLLAEDRHGHAVNPGH